MASSIRQNIGWISSPVVALIANTTLGYTHYGKTLTNRGAAGALVHTLPNVSAALNGVWFQYRGVANQDVTFSTNTSGQLVVVGNAAATSIVFNTAAKKIGVRASFYCDGTSWFATSEDSGLAAGGGGGDSDIVGEIRMYGGSSAPTNWLFCDGGTQLIATYPNLASVLGTTYGGDGVNTFGIPDFRGRVPIHEGTGAGLTARSLGASGGGETNTIGITNLPSHAHTQPAQSAAGTLSDPTGAYPAAHSSKNDVPYHASTNVNMANTGSTGGGNAISIMNPFLVVNFIIRAD